MASPENEGMRLWSSGNARYSWVPQSFGTVMTTATICRTTTPEFTLEKPLLVTYMAGPLDDKHRCFYHGQELQPRAQPQKTLKLRGFLQVLKQPFSMRNTCLKTGFETWRPAPYSASPYLGSTTSEPGVFEQGLEVRTLHIWWTYCGFMWIQRPRR